MTPSRLNSSAACLLCFFLGTAALSGQTSAPVTTNTSAAPETDENKAGLIFAQACSSATRSEALPALGRQFDDFVSRFPQSSGLRELTELYLDTLARIDLRAAIAAEEGYAQGANPTVARIAARRTEARGNAAARAREMESLPWEAIQFTAIDGRQVDVAKLRGRVVLLDFWATWCGPCVSELPNVVEIYRKYHDQGFEVVGLTFENSYLQDWDTPAQREAKLARAKEHLAAFASKRGAVWPQYFDGLGMHGRFATPYHVDGIPMTILLDRSGRMVGRDLFGPDLEKIVKEHLAQ